MERVSRINTDASARARRSILSYRVPTRIYTSKPSIPEYLHSQRLPRTHYTLARGTISEILTNRETFAMPETLDRAD